MFLSKTLYKYLLWIPTCVQNGLVAKPLQSNCTYSSTIVQNGLYTPTYYSTRAAVLLSLCGNFAQPGYRSQQQQIRL